VALAHSQLLELLLSDLCFPALRAAAVALQREAARLRLAVTSRPDCVAHDALQAIKIEAVVVGEPHQALLALHVKVEKGISEAVVDVALDHRNELIEFLLGEVFWLLARIERDGFSGHYTTPHEQTSLSGSSLWTSIIGSSSCADGRSRHAVLLPGP